MSDYNILYHKKVKYASIKENPPHEFSCSGTTYLTSLTIHSTKTRNAPQRKFQVMQTGENRGVSIRPPWVKIAATIETMRNVARMNRNAGVGSPAVIIKMIAIIKPRRDMINQFI
jgi:hypothetical protein